LEHILIVVKSSESLSQVVTLSAEKAALLIDEKGILRFAQNDIGFGDELLLC
jgi:hypothetical protein